MVKKTHSGKASPYKKAVIFFLLFVVLLASELLKKIYAYYSDTIIKMLSLSSTIPL